MLLGGSRTRARLGRTAAVLGMLFLMLLAAFGQTTADTGQVRGVVKDPAQAAVSGAQVILTDQQTKGTAAVDTDTQGSYVFRSLRPGIYVVEVQGKGFKKSESSPFRVGSGETVTFDVSLMLAEIDQSVTVVADAENAYRVETVAAGGPMGNAPILNVPFSVNVISR